MLRFASVSSYTFFLVFLLLLAGLFIVRSLMSKRTLTQSFSKRHLKYYFGNVSVFSSGFLKFTFLFIGFLFSILALFRPQQGMKKIELSAEGVEAVFVIDVSKSMAAEDVKPQRLKLAQIQLKRLTQILDGNKMGLIAFAGQVGVISPLTQDVGALNLFIDSLGFDIFSEQGTNIGFAISEAQDLLLKGKNQKASTTKVVVLVSDGEDHSKETLAAVKMLKSKGIRVFVIAVGTNAGGKIPIKDRFNQVIGYQRNRERKVVKSIPNFSFLKEIAKAGNGGFYKLDFGSKANKALAKDFENLKKSKFESQNFEVKAEYFQFPLSLGIIFIFISFLIKLVSRSQNLDLLWKWGPRMKTLSYLTFILAFNFLISCDYLSSREFKKALQNENCPAALKSVLKELK